MIKLLEMIIVYISSNQSTLMSLNIYSQMNTLEFIFMCFLNIYHCIRQSAYYDELFLGGNQ